MKALWLAVPVAFALLSSGCNSIGSSPVQPREKPHVSAYKYPGGATSLMSSDESGFRVREVPYE